MIKLKVTFVRNTQQVREVIIEVDDAFRSLTIADQLEAARAKAEMAPGDWVDGPPVVDMVSVEHVK